MNYITDDRGNTVVAVGMPGSQARLAVQYPKLIERLNYIFWEGNYPGNRIDLAIEEIRKAGGTDHSDTTNILKISHFGRERVMEGDE